MSIIWIGLVIILASIMGSWLLVKYRNPTQERQVQILFFGLYFWGLAFFQLAISAAVYYWVR